MEHFISFIVLEIWLRTSKVDITHLVESANAENVHLMDFWAMMLNSQMHVLMGGGVCLRGCLCLCVSMRVVPLAHERGNVRDDLRGQTRFVRSRWLRILSEAEFVLHFESADAVVPQHLTGSSFAEWACAGCLQMCAL